MKNKKIKRYLPALATNPIVLFVAFTVVVGFGLFSVVSSYVGASPKVVVEGDYIEAAGQAQESLGSIAGHVVLNREQFAGGLITNALGGNVLTTASGSRTYTASEICDNSVITLDGDTYASTQAQTLPSAASLISNCLSQKGDYHDVFWLNLSVDELPTIAKGTTIDILVASSSTGTTVEIPVNRGVWSRFLYAEGASVSVQFDEFKHQ